MRRVGIWVGVLVMVSGSLACDLNPGVPVTPTLAPTQPLPSLTATIVVSLTLSITDTPTFTLTPTVTRSLTPGRTATPTRTASPTRTNIPSPTVTASPSATPLPSNTGTLSPSSTASDTPTATDTPIPLTATSTATSSVTPSATASVTITFSATPTVSPTITLSPTVTVRPTLTASLTPSITDTPLPPLPPPTLSPTPLPTLTPTLTPLPTDTPFPTATASNTATFSLIPATPAPPTPTFSLIPATLIPPTNPPIPTPLSSPIPALTLAPSLTPLPPYTRIPQPTHRGISFATSTTAPVSTPTLTPIAGLGSGDTGNGSNGVGNGNSGGNNGSTTGSGAGTPVVGPYATVTALAQTPIPSPAILYSIYGNGTPPSIYSLNGILIGFGPSGLQKQYAINPQTGTVAAINPDGVLSINAQPFTLSPYSRFGPPQRTPAFRILKITWSPDGRFLLFQTATDGAASGKLDTYKQTIDDGLWVYDLATNTTRQIFRDQYICCANLPIQIVADAEWAADSKNVLVTFTDGSLTPILIDSTQTINLNPVPGK